MTLELEAILVGIVIGFTVFGGSLLTAILLVWWDRR